ncbi:MAG: tRNA (adenosine(37)-N6)-threonylcarbamoyltransferase complex ATPase subunit type 1 TsaE [Caldilineales bacterium]|nr:tRNA (adenosine(37)-N6)-threonylcarbamoyltransferase complex ATPase subunit type 1 TsaE [Caldilineales bacterium]
MKQAIFESHGEAETESLGAALAAVLPNGSVVALDGALGAGKTRLVQAIAAASGVDRQECVSPTFVLIHEYAGRRPIFHFDAYRLRDEDEFVELGAEEYFDRDGLVLIEWAERIERSLPNDRLEIRIRPLGATSRRFEFTAWGADYEQALDALARLPGITSPQ